MGGRPRNTKCHVSALDNSSRWLTTCCGCGTRTRVTGHQIGRAQEPAWWKDESCKSASRVTRHVHSVSPESNAQTPWPPALHSSGPPPSAAEQRRGKKVGVDGITSAFGK